MGIMNLWASTSPNCWAKKIGMQVERVRNMKFMDVALELIGGVSRSLKSIQVQNI